MSVAEALEGLASSPSAAAPTRDANASSGGVDPHREAISIADRLDRLPIAWLHIAIIAISTLGLFTDIAEVALSNALAAVFLAPPHLVPQQELSLLLAAVFAGGAIGAPALGWLGDRFGRRLALQAALAVMCVSSIAAATSPDVRWMTFFRVISGLAIGGYPPLTATYLADILPPRQRGGLMALCAALAFLGAPAILFLIRGLTPAPPLDVEPWRWALLLGGFVAAIAAFLLASAPESPRWLAATGRREAAEAACWRFERAAGRDAPPSFATTMAEAGQRHNGFRALAASPLHLRRAMVLAALYLLGPWTMIGFPLLSAAAMVQKGFAVGDSLLFAAVAMLGPTVGTLATATFIDRVERRYVLLGCICVMAAAGFLFAAGATLELLMVAGVAFNFASAVYGATLAIYAAEIFPTEQRASVTAGAWGLTRIVSAIVPIALLPILTHDGAWAMFAIMAASLLAISALIIRAAPPGRSRKSVL
ncbi:MFS transporter [Terrarubrum flagellatum]|uniref:MFS transporter n=1 Tax=Terrirubrum flagellatum TaxID=2895980 RepID=UPI0031455498